VSASLQITTLARVKAAASQVAASNDARIAEVIESVSEFAESFMSRHLLYARRNGEEYCVKRGQPLVWLRGMPIGQIHSVKYATRRRFTDVVALDSADYDLHDEEGQLELRIPLIGDPGWLQLDYEGGMALDTATFVADYGAIAEAATMECVARLNRQGTPDGNLRALDSGVAFQKPLEPLKAFLDALSQRRRFAA
jgi:hypothetical protein